MRKAAVVSILVCAVVLAVGVVARAQQPKKLSRIGYLSSVEPSLESTHADGIRLALRERGYIEGQNIATEYRYAEGKQDRFLELAAELVRLKVDIIVAAGGNRMVRAAKNATKTIPIVMAGGGSDPIAAGLIESLAHPGGNVTGLTNLTTELGGKRLELLKEAVPKLAHVAVLYDPANPANVLDVKEVLPVAARALKLTIQPCARRAKRPSPRRRSRRLRQRRPRPRSQPCGPRREGRRPLRHRSSPGGGARRRRPRLPPPRPRSPRAPVPP